MQRRSLLQIIAALPAAIAGLALAREGRAAPSSEPIAPTLQSMRELKARLLAETPALDWDRAYARYRESRNGWLCSGFPAAGRPDVYVRASYDDLLHWPDRSLWTIVDRELSAPIVTLRYNEGTTSVDESDRIVQIGRLRAAGKLETVVLRGEPLEPLPSPFEGVRLVRSGPIVRHTGWPDGRYERSVEA